MGPELQNARVAIRWATDYLLKCARATPGKLYVGVGDPNGDHKCWERPEDMDTPRTVYSVSASNPGSDVAGETAAALAASSMVFRKVDPKYSRLLLATGKKVMQFAIQYRGAYSDSLSSAVCPFYCSYSGYKVCIHICLPLIRIRERYISTNTTLFSIYSNLMMTGRAGVGSGMAS